MTTHISWAPEVIADSSGKWSGNQLRFATKKEADDYAYDLSLRWTAVQQTRAVESDDPITHTYDVRAGLHPVKARETAA